MIAAFDYLRKWRRSRTLLRFPLDQSLWRQAVRELDVLSGLNQSELDRLYTLVALFVHEKRFFGTHKLQVNAYMRSVIGTQACLLILNLTSETAVALYPGWKSIILYPGAFVARHDYRDDIGLVHERVVALEGETSNHGPMVISWNDARPAAAALSKDRNVVLHEFAHKLDYLDGTSNGHPPLHADMSSQTWSRVFNAAFENLRQIIERGHHPPLNPYAATNPTEFFAVMTEVFFQLPHRLQSVYPAVYDQLVLYYRQNPASRR